MSVLLHLLDQNFCSAASPGHGPGVRGHAQAWNSLIKPRRVILERDQVSKLCQTKLAPRSWSAGPQTCWISIIPCSSEGSSVSCVKESRFRSYGAGCMFPRCHFLICDTNLSSDLPEFSPPAWPWWRSVSMGGYSCSPSPPHLEVHPV